MSKYEVAVAFGFYRVGQVIEPTGLRREALLRSGWIKPVIAAGPEPESETTEAPRKRGKKRTDAIEQPTL